MKKLFYLTSILMVFMMSPMVMADQVTFKGGYGPFQTGSGGEFTVKPDAGLSWVLSYYVPGITSNFVETGTFQTFCVEGNEYISSNTTYDVFLNNRAIMGSQPTNGDPISQGTAWLYYEFATAGNFDGYATYDYTNPGRSGSGNSADLLQKAIWWLEGEKNIGFNSSNPFMAAVVDEFGSQDNAKLDNYLYGRYPVAVLNLYTLDGRLAQDQLVLTPEPATMLLLGSGLIGLAGFVRRKFKR